MKSLMNRIAIVAAGALMAGTAAYGQEKVVAEIPFAFQMSGFAMPAGNYEVIGRPGGASIIFAFRNLTTGKTGLAANGIFTANQTPSGTTQLVFACSGPKCALAAVKTSAGARNYYPTMKLSAREKEELATVEIAVRAVKAE